MAKALDVVQGTLDLLILKALSVESFHGWGISARIEELSGDVFHSSSRQYSCEKSHAVHTSPNASIPFFGGSV